MYFVYILRCRDDSLYCGTARDYQARLRAHFTGDKKAARYTKSHAPLRPEAVWQCERKGDALRLEYRIKQLSRQDKLQLIASSRELPVEDASLYIRLPQSALVSKDGLW